MLGDHCGEDVDKKDASVTVSYEVATGKAAPLSKAFQASGGEVLEEPAMMFWGQGKATSCCTRLMPFVERWTDFVVFVFLLIKMRNEAILSCKRCESCSSI